MNIRCSPYEIAFETIFGPETMLLGGQTTEFYMHECLPFLHIALHNTGFGFPIIHKSHKPHPLQMRFERLIVRLEEWKVVGRLGRDSFALFAAILQVLSFNMSPCCVHGHCRALALISNAKQAMGERKSGPVETRLTGPAARALYMHLIIMCMFSQVVLRELSGFVVGPVLVTDVWRCAGTMPGAPCVMICGILLMLLWCADS